eukprot:2044458-Pleurochrysis_carterae.AAC.1
MNAALAEALLKASAAGHGTPELGAEAGAPEAEAEVSGGRVTDGPELDPYVRARVERARCRPPRFASFRNLAPMDEAA